MDMRVIHQLAYQLFGEKSSHPGKEKGNKYYHGERVAKLAVRLRELLFPDDASHDETLTVAAWFHDIMNGLPDHARAGAERAREVLAGHCSGDELEEICGIIAVHDERKPQSGLYTPQIMLHQDADHLDHFGTFDIWMITLYTASHGQTMDDAIDWLYGKSKGYHQRCRTELNFDISKLIFDEKAEFVSNYAERFRAEANGEIWNAEKLPSIT